jgi:hypothetical protein
MVVLLVSVVIVTITSQSLPPLMSWRAAVLTETALIPVAVAVVVVVVVEVVIVLLAAELPPPRH